MAAFDYKLSKKKLRKLNKDLNHFIEKYNQQYQSKLEPRYIEARKVYEADKAFYEQMYPKLSKTAKIVSMDVHNIIETIMPNIMRIMFDSTEIISFTGTNEANNDNAKTFEKLIAFQIQRNKNGYMIMYDWFKAGLIDNIAFLKCFWEYEDISETRSGEFELEKFLALQQRPDVIIESFEYVEVDNANVVAAQEAGDEEPEVFAAEIEPVRSYYKVKYNIITEIVKNQPEFCLVPPSEIRYDITCRNIDDADLIIHRKIVTADWLLRREKEGMFKGVKDAIKFYNNSERPNTRYDNYLARQTTEQKGDRNHELEDAKKEYLYYECYYDTDIDDDGLLEKVVVGKLGDRIIRVEENTTGRHPFFHVMPSKDPFSIIPRNSLVDQIGQIQHAKTALTRQVIISVANANDKQCFVNVHGLENEDELIQGHKHVRTNTNPNEVVSWAPWQAIDEATFPLMQRLDDEVENITGITKYTQGTDSTSLNQTATGISRIMDAATQRLDMIVRLYVETGVKPLYRYLIKLNKMNITQETVIRVAGEQLVVSPDDLEGKIDVDINIGLTMGTRSEKVNTLGFIMNSQLNALQIGAVGPEHVAYTIGKIIDEAGYKDIGRFAYKPEEVIEKQQQQQQSQQEMMMAEFQAQLEAEIAKIRANGENQVALAEKQTEGKLELEAFKEQSKYNEKEYDEIKDPLGGTNDTRRITSTIPIDKLPPNAQVQLAGQMGVEMTEEDIRAEQQAATERDIEKRKASITNP